MLSKISSNIESKLFEKCGRKIEGQYTDGLLLLIRNLKQSYNKDLRLKLLNSDITCEQISKMNADDFLSEQAKKEKEE